MCAVLTAGIFDIGIAGCVSAYLVPVSNITYIPHLIGFAVTGLGHKAKREKKRQT